MLPNIILLIAIICPLIFFFKFFCFHNLLIYLFKWYLIFETLHKFPSESTAFTLISIEFFLLLSSPLKISSIFMFEFLWETKKNHNLNKIQIFLDHDLGHFPWFIINFNRFQENIQSYHIITLFNKSYKFLETHGVCYFDFFPRIQIFLFFI